MNMTHQNIHNHYTAVHQRKQDCLWEQTACLNTCRIRNNANSHRNAMPRPTQQDHCQPPPQRLLAPGAVTPLPPPLSTRPVPIPPQTLALGVARDTAALPRQPAAQLRRPGR